MDTQPVASRVTSATVIGRREELAAIGAAVASATSGQPRIVLVGGEAGIGKTRLITEACAAAEQDGVLCAVGGCVQLGGASLAYAPLVEALRGLRRQFGEQEFSELLGPATASVGVLLGIGEGGSVAQGRLFEQLLGLISRLAVRQPLLMVFEDLHWADASTRDLVAFLGRNLRAAPVALVLTYRSDELHRRHPWWTVLAGLERDPHVERPPVRGLSRPELAALIGQVSDERWSVEDLLHRTDGNPFYVEELVAAADLAGRVPPTLAELILARVNGLSDPTPGVLHEAAVLGELVDDMWLVELSGRPLPIVIEALREAVSHHLLTVDGAGCRFRHALVREAL
jgi:predicted ATPase